MAKWGEGDPRWIVEERPDAVNVNNWHWTEKNATPWSKEKLRSQFEGFELVEGDIKCVIDKVDKLTGEASANNRKGKLIFFYEWDIVLKWSGRLNEGQQEATTGTVRIPNLSEENDLDEIDIQVMLDKSDADGDKLKQFMWNIGRGRLRKLLEIYLVDLRHEFSKGMILPKKQGDADSQPTAQLTTTKPAVNSGMKNITSGFNNKISLEAVKSPPASTTLGCKISTATINMNERFRCEARALYEVLVSPGMATAFTKGPVKLDAIKGGEFSFFGGNISGRFEELIPNKLIRQTWRYKEWPAGHYSEVRMELEEDGSGETALILRQTGVPSADQERTKQNWSTYYWESIKVTFGFGSFLV